MHRPLLQRLALLDPLEDESNWSHGSLHNVVILRAQYVQLQHVEAALLPPGTMTAGSTSASGASMLVAPSSLASSAVVDHPYCGIEIVTTSSHSPQRYVWIPQDAVTVRFQAGMVEELDANVRRAHLMVQKDCSSSTPAPVSGGGGAVCGRLLRQNEEVVEEEEEKVDMFDNQYVEFHASEVDSGSVEPGWVLHCMLRRIPSTQEHYWSCSRHACPWRSRPNRSGRSRVIPLLCRCCGREPDDYIGWWRWLLSASSNLCSKCGNVDDGKPTNGPLLSCAALAGKQMATAIACTAVNHTYTVGKTP